MDQGLLDGEAKSKERCCAKYNFSTWSRALAAISSILILILSIVTISRIESALFGIASSILVWIIEVPFFFGCCCEGFVEKLKCLEASKENPKGCVFRAIVYLGLCMGGSAICVEVNGGNVVMLLCFILLGVDGLCYLGAFFQGVGTPSNATFASAAKRAASNAGGHAPG